MSSSNTDTFIEISDDNSSFVTAMDIAINKKWDLQIEELLKNWSIDIHKLHCRHDKYAGWYNIFHYLFGIPTIVIGSIAASATFITFKNCEDSDWYYYASEWIRLATGIISVTAVVLSALQTFLNFSKSSEEHKRAAGDYLALYHQVIAKLKIPFENRGDPVIVLQDIRGQFDSIYNKSPSFLFGNSEINELTYSLPKPPKPADIKLGDISVIEDFLNHIDEKSTNNNLEN